MLGSSQLLRGSAQSPVVAVSGRWGGGMRARKDTPCTITQAVERVKRSTSFSRYTTVAHTYTQTHNNLHTHTRKLTPDIHVNTFIHVWLSLSTTTCTGASSVPLTACIPRKHNLPTHSPTNILQRGHSHKHAHSTTHNDTTIHATHLQQR